MADILGIKALGFKGLAGSHLIPAPEKLTEVAEACISDGFAWVSEHKGEIVAAVCALVHPLTFYYGNQATAVQFYSVKPGEGMKLLRRFVTWCRAREDIRMYCITLEADADPRLHKVMTRLGLTAQMPVYGEVKA